MINRKPLITLVMALFCGSYAFAYEARITNKTSGDITFSINLAACRPIQTGIIKQGETKSFQTGGCCFESVNAMGVTDRIKNISSGDVRPWGDTWQCFYNLHFTVSEKHADGKVTGLIIEEKTLR